MEIRGLGVRFGPLRALDDVGFAVARGEAFGLIGESGSGKSTVLRTIAGLVPGVEGEVFLGGRPAPPRRDRAFLRAVQMVFQDPYASLHPRKLVRAALMEPLRNFCLDDRERRVAAALASVELEPHFAHRFPHQLSGGQRQRVSIARCLVLEPEVLLLDEPTSALDVSVQAGVLNLLADLRRDRGLTYILVSHDLAVVAHLCDRVAVMTEGRIIETLTVDALRAQAATHPYARELIAASRSARRTSPPAGRPAEMAARHGQQ